MSKERKYHACGARCGACKKPLDEERDAVCLGCCSRAEEHAVFCDLVAECVEHVDEWNFPIGLADRMRKALASTAVAEGRDDG